VRARGAREGEVDQGAAGSAAEGASAQDAAQRLKERGVSD